MAKVNFKRIENSANIDNIDITDGNFIITGDGKSYIDYGNNRIPTNGTLDEEMSDNSSNAVENRIIKNYIDTNVNALKPVLLWTNSSPTSSFTSQDITLSSSDYDMLIIFYYDYVTNASNARINSTVIPKLLNGEKAVLQSIFIAPTDDIFVASRTILFTNSATTLTFGDSKGGTVNSSGNAATNTTNVPYIIIGYKTGLFE